MTMTNLAEQVLKILRRMEPSTALKAFRLDLPGMDDAEILARCGELGIKVDGELSVSTL